MAGSAKLSMEIAKNVAGQNQFTYNSQTFALSYTADFGGGGFGSTTGNDLALTVIAVPEPNSALALLGGLTCLNGLPRLRRRV